MANNKVQLADGTVLMDTSGVTVTADTLLVGRTALAANGEVIVGTFDPYPVGAIYISVVETSPSMLFGGTWERLEGRFLLAATIGGTEGTNIQGDRFVAPGGTGGEATHQLSLNEMPRHRHIVNRSQVAASGTARNIVQGNSGTDAYTDYAGNDQAHNNMPPFLAVYMWKRLS